MRTVRARLESLAEAGATGTLSLGDDGAFHLVDGAVVHAETAHTPSLRELLTASGRLTEQGWELLRAQGPGHGPASPARLGAAEFEAHALIHFFDAAFFLARSGHEPRFEDGKAPYWPECLAVDPVTLCVEIRRRRVLLDAAWPSPLADDEPVRPLRRVSRQRVILTGLQAEILLNADGRKTPSGLARELGRTRFGCVLAVRGLVASALVRPPGSDDGGARAEDGAPAPRIGGAPRWESQPRDGAFPAKWAHADLELLARLHDALRELE
ncbi:hypothetical protein LO762_11925 [Actinocorallia sp. API 0066]|uniref:hypothetical protein n=1 Tax=Actinocorallia sp. API 0066 TaxID=2896846 RepID=UPI001E2BC6DE|nr:hypothetical protein [Actinocorallia sp. API 0066]MCD0449891.1 hypothetical protein [Actinocorallia sp. API 0066]